MYIYLHKCGLRAGDPYQQHDVDPDGKAACWLRLYQQNYRHYNKWQNTNYYPRVYHFCTNLKGINPLCAHGFVQGFCCCCKSRQFCRVLTGINPFRAPGLVQVFFAKADCVYRGNNNLMTRSHWTPLTALRNTVGLNTVQCLCSKPPETTMNRFVMPQRRTTVTVLHSHTVLGFSRKAPAVQP